MELTIYAGWKSIEVASITICFYLDAVLAKWKKNLSLFLYIPCFYVSLISKQTFRLLVKSDSGKTFIQLTVDTGDKLVCKKEIVSHFIKRWHLSFHYICGRCKRLKCWRMYKIIATLLNSHIRCKNGSNSIELNVNIS